MQSGLSTANFLTGSATSPNSRALQSSWFPSRTAWWPSAEDYHRTGSKMPLAEAWAFAVVLQMSPAMPYTVTACLNVVNTVRGGRCGAVAASSPLARFCTRVLGALDDQDCIAADLAKLWWMLAHGGQGTIGRASRPDGTAFSAVEWRANRLVDLLAKSAASQHRIDSKRAGLSRPLPRRWNTPWPNLGPLPMLLTTSNLPRCWAMVPRLTPPFETRLARSPGVLVDRVGSSVAMQNRIYHHMK